MGSAIERTSRVTPTSRGVCFTAARTARRMCLCPSCQYVLSRTWMPARHEKLFITLPFGLKGRLRALLGSRGISGYLAKLAERDLAKRSNPKKSCKLHNSVGD